MGAFLDALCIPLGLKEGLGDMVLKGPLHTFFFGGIGWIEAPFT